jgi:hypothetical protein
MFSVLKEKVGSSGCPVKLTECTGRRMEFGLIVKKASMVASRDSGFAP